MSVDRRKLRALLQWYLQDTSKDVVAVLVINRDGMGFDVLTRSKKKNIKDTLLGNVSLLIDLILKKITREFTYGSFGVGTFDTEQYRYLFCEAGPDYILVTVLDALAMVDPIFPYAYLVAEKVARIFDGRPVSPVIPKLYVEEGTPSIERKMNTLQKIKIHSPLYAYKLILGGDGGVGKTSMVHRFVDDVFQTDYKRTIGTSITKKECQFDGLDSKVRFVIWDLGGQVQFKRVRQSYLAEAEAGILVFDLTRRDTYENIKSWYREIKDNSPPGMFLILVGNKCDLEEERVVSTQEGEKLAQELGLTYMETSAKTGENVNDAFKMLAIQMIKRFVEPEELEEIDAKTIPQESNEDNKIIPEFILEEEKIVESDPSKWQTQVSANNVWARIEDFTAWLEININLLNQSLGFTLFPVNKRRQTLFAKDKLDRRVLIDSQLGKSEDEYLGRIITTLMKHDAKIAVWICENPLPEHVKVIESFNEKNISDASFYVVKMEVFMKDSTTPAPKFSLISKPLEREPEKEKEIGDKKEEIIEKKSEISDEESVDQKRFKFWEQFIERLNTNFPEHAYLTPQSTSNLFASAGKEGLKYGYNLSANWSSIELRFDHPNQLVNSERFKQIQANKDEIFLLSDEFEWDYDERRSYQSIIFKIEGGLNNKENWDKVQNKMVIAMKLLVNRMKDFVNQLRL